MQDAQTIESFGRLISYSGRRTYNKCIFTQLGTVSYGPIGIFRSNHKIITTTMMIVVLKGR